MTHPDPVLVVGTAAYDTVKTPFAQAERVLGGSAVYFSAACGLFSPVHLVSVVGGDFDLGELSFLEDRGVDLTGLEVREQAETFHWSGEYHYDMNTRTTHATDLNVLTEFDPVIPDPVRDVPLVFLANIDPNLQLKVLDQMNEPRLVAMDTMNYWIEETPEALDEVLARVDVLIINDEEAREIGGSPNVVKAMAAIQERGVDTIVVKKGEHGCLLAHGDHRFAAPAFLMEDVHDPTGAGDAFAGAFMGTLATEPSLDDLALRRAAIYGTAAASLVIEDFGPRALAKATHEDIADRVRRLERFTRFPELG